MLQRGKAEQGISLKIASPLATFAELFRSFCRFVREFVVHEERGMLCVLGWERQLKAGITSATLPPCQRLKTI